jgi:t-SNARE complex subunit (syntaxin)
LSLPTTAHEKCKNIATKTENTSKVSKEGVSAESSAPEKSPFTCDDSDQIKSLSGTNQQQVEKDRSSLDEKVAENKRYGVRIRNALKKEQDRLDDKSIAAAKEDGQKKSAKENHEMRLRRTQIAAQSRRFYDLWTEYNNQQVDYRDRSKELLKRRCRIVNENISEDEIETMLDEGSTQMFNASILEDTTKAREQLNELKDRHDEFVKLERSIREVHDLFIELGALVTQQGELINNIAHNVEQAEERVEKGRKQLSDAERHQRSARRKKAICFTIIFVAALILLLVVLGELGAFSHSDSEPEQSNTKAPPTDDSLIDPTIVAPGGPTPETQTDKIYDKGPLEPPPT